MRNLPSADYELRLRKICRINRANSTNLRAIRLQSCMYLRLILTPKILPSFDHQGFGQANGRD